MKGRHGREGGDSSPLPLLPLLKRIEIMGRICIKGKVFSEASLSRPSRKNCSEYLQRTFAGVGTECPAWHVIFLISTPKTLSYIYVHYTAFKGTVHRDGSGRKYMVSFERSLLKGEARRF